MDLFHDGAFVEPAVSDEDPLAYDGPAGSVEPPPADEPPDIELLPIIPLDHGDGMMVPRLYQLDCVDLIFEELQTNVSTLVVMATGLGKTIVCAELILRWPHGRILFLAHREELIYQARDKIGHHIDEACAIEMGVLKEHRGGHGLLDKSKVLIASVQTMSRPNRSQFFNPMDFSLIITDECAHATSKSYRQIYSYFHQNPQLRHVGVTATPKRADGAAMGDIYQTVAFEMDIREGIDQGYLVDIEQRMIVIEGLDFSSVRTTAGDFNQRDLASVMLGGAVGAVAITGSVTVDEEAVAKEEAMLHAVVSPTIAESAGRPTLVFAVTKDHAEKLCEVFNRHPGVVAEFVTDATPKDQRQRILKQFAKGEIQVICNVGVLTEGFDSRVDFVVIARPTKSESLYRQMVGRGTRPLAGNR